MTEDTESVAERLLFFSADGCHQLRRLLRIVAMSANRWDEEERDEEEEEEEEAEEEEETRSLREEVTTSAGCLLYRLCEMVKYCSAAEEGVDLRKLLRLLSDEPDAPRFYEAMLRQLFRRIVRGRNASTTMTTTTSTTTKVAPMSPTEAIAFFQRFSVLNFTLQHNAVLTEFIRNNFSEEFRYYIEPKKIRAMIPSRYPVHSATVALVQRVANAVFRRVT